MKTFDGFSVVFGVIKVVSRQSKRAYVNRIFVAKDRTRIQRNRCGFAKRLVIVIVIVFANREGSSDIVVKDSTYTVRLPPVLPRYTRSSRKRRHIGATISFICRGIFGRRFASYLAPSRISRPCSISRLDLHRQLVGHLIRGDLVLAVGVGGQLGLDAVDERLDRVDLPAVGGLGGELQFFVCGNVDRVGVVVNLVPVLGKGDGGAVCQIQLDGSKLVLLDRRRRLGLGARNRVGRGVRGGGFGCRLGRRLDGLDHGLFGCLRAVGRRGLIRRSRRLIGHGGACRLRSGGLHAGVVHRRRDVLACLLVGHRGGCKRRRAHHLRGEQDRQDDRRRLDAEIPPSSQDSAVGLHKTPPTFSAAISRGCPPSGCNASCAPTRGRTSIPAPAHQARARLARRRAFAFRAKTIASIFTTYSGPLYPPKNESGRTGNECAPISG